MLHSIGKCVQSDCCKPSTTRVIQADGFFYVVCDEHVPPKQPGEAIESLWRTTLIGAR